MGKAEADRIDAAIAAAETVIDSRTVDQRNVEAMAAAQLLPEKLESLASTLRQTATVSAGQLVPDYPHGWRTAANPVVAAVCDALDPLTTYSRVSDGVDASRRLTAAEQDGINWELLDALNQIYMMLRPIWDEPPRPRAELPEHLEGRATHLRQMIRPVETPSAPTAPVVPAPMLLTQQARPDQQSEGDQEGRSYRPNPETLGLAVDWFVGAVNLYLTTPDQGFVWKQVPPQKSKRKCATHERALNEIGIQFVKVPGTEKSNARWLILCQGGPDAVNGLAQQLHCPKAQMAKLSDALRKLWT